MSASDHGIVWALGPSPPLTSNTVSWLTFDASAVAGTYVDENESDDEMGGARTPTLSEIRDPRSRHYIPPRRQDSPDDVGNTDDGSEEKMEESDEEPKMEESEEEPKMEEPEEDSKMKESSEKSKMADHLRITIAQ